MRSASGVWKASSKRSSATIVSRLALTDVSKTDVAHESGIEVTSLANLFQGLEDKSVEWSVLEGAFIVFAKRCSQCERNDYVVRVLLSAGCLG